MDREKNATRTIIAVFLLCSAAEYIEFLFIKTDQTFISENVICKFFALALILFIMKRKDWTPSDIGFKPKGLLKSAGLGFALGISTFFLSYLAELLVLRSMGKLPELRFYITNFTLSDPNVTGISLSAVVICLLGNVINVLAEEGLFRGLFIKLGRSAMSEKKSNLLQALLFGIWHVVMVAVWLSEGAMDIHSAIGMSFGYVILAGILGYEWGLCVSLTGTIWAGAFEHFFNNFITNALHTVTETGVDELQIMRIVLSNILSLLFVLIISRYAKKRRTAEA